MPDVTELLEQDHREVEGLFKEFERTGDRSIILRVCDELEVHTAVEEEIVYPVLFREVDRDLAEEGKQEHSEAARIIAQIRELPDGDGRLRAYVSRLKDAVTHHVKEEEGEVFPKVAAAADEATLMELGQRLAQARTLSTRDDRPRSS